MRPTWNGAARHPARAHKSSRSVFLTIVAVVVIAGVVAYLALGSGRAGGGNPVTANLNTGSASNMVWPVQVREIAAQFNCPCEKCGIVRLDECTCDIPRGSVEVKSFIQSLLSQALPKEEIIKRVDERYSHRI